MSTQVTASTQQATEQSADPSTDTDSATATETQREQEEDVPLDVVFDMLSVKRRRQVLRYLLDESETTTLSDLAEHIAASENDKPEAALSSKERKRVYVGLYQCHLPRMADAGVIDYEPNRGTVEPGVNIEAVTSYLPAEEGPSTDQQWPTIHLAVGFAGAGLFILQALLYPHALIAGFSIGLVVSSCILVALAHALSEGRWSPELGVLDPSSDDRPD